MDQNFRNKIYLIVILIVVVSFIILFIMQKTNQDSKKLLPAKIGEAEIKVEIVESKIGQAKGLSGRIKLPWENGMLFIYPDKEVKRFHMKGMLFPIDIIWLSDGEVVGTVEKLERYQEDGNLSVVSSPEPVNRVLEVNAGFVEYYGIEKGSRFELLTEFE